MIRSVDMFICLTGIGAFILFFVLHLVLLRVMGAHDGLKAIRLSGMVTVFVQAISLFYGFYQAGYLTQRPELIFSLAVIALSVVISGFLMFIYVLWFLGPMLTSIRYRLVRLLAKSMTPVSTDDVLKEYNALGIMNERLARLIASGDIRRQGASYVLVKKVSIFLLIDRITLFLKRMIQHDSK